MTLLFDTLFKTVKHPKEDALELARGTKPMSQIDKARSAQLSEAILAQRGREALRSDDAAGGEGASLVKRPIAAPAAASG